MREEHKALSRFAMGLARLAEFGEVEMAEQIRGGLIIEVIHARKATRSLVGVLPSDN